MVTEPKKLYCKPEMKEVKLVAEEAVLGGCKTLSGDGIGITVGLNCVTASCLATNVLS